MLSEVEQEQKPSGNGYREAIVVGAGLCDGEGERAYTGYAPHIIRNVSANVFSLRRFGIFFCRNVRRHLFAETSFAETSGIPYVKATSITTQARHDCEKLAITGLEPASQDRFS